MPIADPWSVTQAFINDLNDQTAKNRYYNQQGQNNLYQAMIDRQNTLQTHGWNLAKDENDFNQQLIRDEASREFTHGENWLRSQYENAGKASKSRFAQPGAPAPWATQPPPYVSPLGGTQSTGPTVQTQTAPQAAPVQPAQGGEPEISPQGAYNYYISQGVPALVAAGIVGNMDAESGFDPAVWSGARRGDGGRSGYAGQWNGSRLVNLENFARQRGHASPTPRDQLDFYIHEGRSGLDAGAKRALELAEQSGSPEEAAKWIRMYYERPAEGPTMQEERRQRTARAVFDQGGTSVPSDPATQAQPGPRRYPATAPVAMPDNGGLPMAPDVSQDSQADTTIDDMEHEWTPEELAKYLAPDEIAAISHKGMEVVGPPRMYSDNAMDLLPDEIKANLFPVYRGEQYGPTEYLYMRPSNNEVTEDGTSSGGERQPQITTAPPVEIKKTGDNTIDPQSTEGVRQRGGKWEVWDGERWVEAA